MLQDKSNTPLFDKTRILVVDDQQDYTLLVRSLLRKQFKCHVTMCSSGAAVLEDMRQNSYDIVIADMMMPGLHGVELVQLLRKNWPGTDVIVMTGYAEQFPYVKVIQAGATDFIRKPFPGEELEAKVLRILRERELVRQRTLADLKFRSLYQCNADGVVFVDPATFQIQDANPAFSSLLGVDLKGLTGKSVVEMLSPMDAERMPVWLSMCMKGGTGMLSDVTLCLESDPVAYVDISATVVSDEFETVIFLSFKDVAPRREMENQLVDAALRDGLTGLSNKHCFQQRFPVAVQRARTNNQHVSLLMIDLDNFKKCNDTHGHQIGDVVLTTVGKCITQSLRRKSSDLGFRFGGDEFVVLLQDTDIEGARCVAERIQALFNEEERYGTSMSVGVAQYTQVGMTPKAFLEKTDQAMYQAKSRGKNCVVVLS